MKTKNLIPFLFIIVLFFTNVFSAQIIGQVTGPNLAGNTSESFTINYDGWYTNDQYFSSSAPTNLQTNDRGWYSTDINPPGSYGARNITFTPYRPGFRFEPVSRNYDFLTDITGYVNFLTVDTVETAVEHIAPTGSWEVNVKDTIKFRLDDNSDWVAEYRFFYSIDNGSNYTPICTIHTSTSGEIANGASNPSSTKKRAFTPTVVSDEYILKMEAVDADDNVGIGYSPVFSVIDTTDPSITITSPNGSEIWYIDSSRNITWTATDNCSVASRTIVFSTDNGSNWTVLDSSAGNTGTWSWVIPNISSTQCRVRVRVYDQSGHSNADTSDASFEIKETPDVTNPVVSVTAPTAGESVKSTTNYNVTWTATDNKSVESISIYLSTDNGSNYTKLDSLTSNPGTRSWAVPLLDYPSSILKVYAYDAAGNIGEGSSGVFSIEKVIYIDSIPPVVSVLLPTNGQVFTSGLSIKTKVDASDDVDLAWISYYLSTDGGSNYTFKDSVACPVNNPATIARNFSTSFSLASDQCKFKFIIYDSEGNFSIEYSDLFSVIDVRAPYVTFEFSPFPDTLYSGADQSIAWIASDEVGISYTLLFLSTDNGVTFTKLDSVSPDTMSYLWAVPQIGTPNCFISAHTYDAAGNVGKDTTSVFTIEYIDIISPTVTIDPVQDVIQTDTEYEITWTSSDNVGISHVLIFLSTDSGTTYNKLDRVSPVDSYLWTTPGTNSPGCSFKLQVFDAAGNSNESESNLFDVLLPVSIKHISIPKKFGVRITAQSIVIGMEKTAKVSMGIYTLNGRLLFSKNEILCAGYHRFPRISAHGIYLLRIKRPDKSLIRKFY